MPYPSLCIACNKVQWAAVSKPLLCCEHSKHSPTSPLGQYCVGSLRLNFGQKRSGVLILKERSNLCAAHLKMQRSAGFKVCKRHQIAWGCRIRAYVLHALQCSKLLYLNLGISCHTVSRTSGSKLMCYTPQSAVNFFVLAALNIWSQQNFPLIQGSPHTHTHTSVSHATLSHTIFHTQLFKHKLVT